jgi:hypothetical protein
VSTSARGFLTVTLAGNTSPQSFSSRESEDVRGVRLRFAQGKLLAPDANGYSYFRGVIRMASSIAAARARVAFDALGPKP